MAVHGFGWLGLFFLKGWGVVGRLPDSGVMRVFVAIGSDLSRIEIFLFCRSGRTFWRFDVHGLPGVSSLAGLGDRRRDLAGDAAAKGVDGLDLAEGVSFADGFRPALGIVVSDVLAQQQDRRFRRLRSEVALGQGWGVWMRR